MIHCGKTTGVIRSASELEKKLELATAQSKPCEFLFAWLQDLMVSCDELVCRVLDGAEVPTKTSKTSCSVSEVCKIIKRSSYPMMSRVTLIHQSPNSISKPREPGFPLSRPILSVISQDFCQNIGYRSLICRSWNEGMRSADARSLAVSIIQRCQMRLTLPLKFMNIAFHQDQSIS